MRTLAKFSPDLRGGDHVVVFGVYEGATEAEALDQIARRAGYDNWREDLHDTGRRPFDDPRGQVTDQRTHAQGDGIRW